MSNKLTALFFLFLMACAPNLAPATPDAQQNAPNEIRYLSISRQRAAVFTQKTVRFGPISAWGDPLPWPYSASSDLITVKSDNNVQCVAMESPNTTLAFAIKRPIKLDDKYQCDTNTFHVIKCFLECSSAIVEVKSPVETDKVKGAFTSYMHIDDCLGMTIFSQFKEMKENVPFNAIRLTGNVGILANKKYPDCDPYDKLPK